MGLSAIFAGPSGSAACANLAWATGLDVEKRHGRHFSIRAHAPGAKVLAVDNNLSSAEETVAMARRSGAECVSFEADVTNQTTLKAMVEAARRRWGASTSSTTMSGLVARWRGRAA